MLIGLYRALLRLPNFKGKGRLEHWMREWFFRPKASSVIHGLKMELDPMEWIQIDLLQRRQLESSLGVLLQEKLRPGDTFVDVGSHVGFYSLQARHFVGATGRVIAVDPQPYNANRLLRNAELNGFTNIEMHIAAAGDTDQFVSLSNQSDMDKARLSLGGEHVNDEAQCFTVPLRRMENILNDGRNSSRIRLMKISVVGYEWQVVCGLGTQLGNIEYLLIDIRDDTTTGHSLKLIERLRQANYLLLTSREEPWQPGEPLSDNNLLAVLAR